MTRRELLAAAIAAPFAFKQLAAADPGKPLFFSRDEFALLETLTELIIPTDDHSPGARAAGVAAYIDKTTAEAVNPEEKRSWADGLKTIDEKAQRSFGARFLLVRPSDQIALLRDQDQKNDPFFGQLKQTTAFAYYSSEIGIHKEMEYKGNVILQEFAGTAV